MRLSECDGLPGRIPKNDSIGKLCVPVHHLEINDWERGPGGRAAYPYLCPNTGPQWSAGGAGSSTWLKEIHVSNAARCVAIPRSIGSLIKKKKSISTAQTAHS